MPIEMRRRRDGDDDLPVRDDEPERQAPQVETDDARVGQRPAGGVERERPEEELDRER